MPFTRQEQKSPFLSLQPNDIATEMNLWDFELFSNINPAEYILNILSRDPEKFPNLDVFIKRFEQVLLYS